jgi:hypothetical protein
MQAPFPHTPVQNIKLFFFCLVKTQTAGKLHPISIGADDAGGGPAVGLEWRDRYPESSQRRIPSYFPFFFLITPFFFVWLFPRSGSSRQTTIQATEVSVHG